ncbi:unnamed protein product [Caenorhabditis angaria]|uniref:Uncharacterized protein n=1 Tax=Caenorhabditis angaria TaxID=860376 RepID=A0A9P1N6Q6_9PELO|nr:unnamed protein product [Caenorhabditis angaria]
MILEHVSNSFDKIGRFLAGKYTIFCVSQRKIYDFCSTIFDYEIGWKFIPFLAQEEKREMEPLVDFSIAGIVAREESGRAVSGKVPAKCQKIAKICGNESEMLKSPTKLL